MRISPPRGIPPEGETKEQKEERLREESLRFAFGPRAAIDAAGNASFVWSYFDNEDQVIQYSTRAAAGPGFSPPTSISEAGENAGEPGIGVDAAGNAVAAWYRNDGTDRFIQVAKAPAGGSFGAATDVSEAGAAADSPLLAVTEGGTASLAWRISGKSESLIQAAVMAPGGQFSVPFDVSSGKNNPLFPDMALSPNGSVVVSWSADSGAKEVPRAAVLTAGAAGFGPPVNLAQTSGEFFHPHVAIDASGDATAIWTRSNGTFSIVQANVFEAGAPRLSGVSIPSKGVVGDPVSVTAATSDFWPIGAPTISFGDGAAAVGGVVSHVYAARGTYPVTVTSTNAAGTPTTASGTIVIRTRGDFKVGKLKKKRRKGTGRLTVTVDGPGTVTLGGAGVKRASVRSSKAGTVELSVAAKGKSLKTLEKTGEVKIKAKISFTPEGGPANVRQVQLTLAKHVPHRAR